MAKEKFVLQEVCPQCDNQVIIDPENPPAPEDVCDLCGGTGYVDSGFVVVSQEVIDELDSIKNGVDDNADKLADIWEKLNE